MKSFRQGESVGDVLKGRGVHTLVYFHTDHFEPWRLIPDRDGGMDRCIDDVESYLRLTASLDFARKASLFYKANVNYLTSADRELLRAHPDDLLGFVPRSTRDRRIGRAIVEPIAASSHDLQVHIHHEYYTFNDTPRDPETFAYLQTPRGRAFDDARLELAIRLGLDTLREDGGIELTRWFFVHGHWALNGSDPHECNVVREIEILKRNGCLGDFTQPAGRVHVDSRIDTPYLVDPVALPKGYDTPEAKPTLAAGAGATAAERFFIWASATTHRTCSIDTYSSGVQQRLKTPDATALDHARSGVVIDGVLYLKTHCHSLHPSYWVGDALASPHGDPGVQAELGALFKGADRAGVAVTFLSASEVYDRIIGAAVPARRDLATEFDLARGSAMDPIGVAVCFRTTDGALAAPPPLMERAAALPAPTLASDVAGGPDVIACIEPVEAAVEVAGWSDPALLDAAFESPRLMAADDVARVNDGACRISLERARDMGAEASGVTGFYGPRAQQHQLLQAAEVLCAHFVQARLPKARTIYEIGCGLGLLSSLLALRGLTVIGIERNGARLASAKAIAETVLGDVRGPKWVKGMYPQVLRRAHDLDASVALVTNLLGSATPEQQSNFVSGLAAFGVVVIDVQRFYIRRTTPAQIADLTAMFASAGFDDPRLAFDLGPDGRFLLFTNPRPRLRLGAPAILSRLGARRREPLFVDQ